MQLAYITDERARLEADLKGQIKIDEDFDFVATVCEKIFNGLDFSKKSNGDYDLRERYGILRPKLASLVALTSLFRTELLKKLDASKSDDLSSRKASFFTVLKDTTDAQKAARAQQASEELREIIATTKPTFDRQAIKNNLSVNLSWIYSNNSVEDYIFPVPYVRQDQEINIFHRIMTWATYYPSVNVWYDSRTVTHVAISNTRKKIDADYPELAGRIFLRDIEELPLVKAHKKAFEPPMTSYFVADTTRLILTLDELAKKPLGSFVIYADLSVPPMSADELLDDETIFNLNRYGIVLPQKPRGRVENNFHLLGNHKENLMKAVQKLLIELNINRALASLNFSQPFKLIGSSWNQVVYDSFPAFFSLFYEMEGLLTLGPLSEELQKIDDDTKKFFLLWQLLGAKVAMPYGSSPQITDNILRLQNIVHQQATFSAESLYIPVKVSDKFPRSHFGGVAD